MDRKKWELAAALVNPADIVKMWDDFTASGHPQSIFVMAKPSEDDSHILMLAVPDTLPDRLLLLTHFVGDGYIPYGMVGRAGPEHTTIHGPDVPEGDLCYTNAEAFWHMADQVCDDLGVVGDDFDDLRAAGVSN